jgi:hypothetical protein
LWSKWSRRRFLNKTKSPLNRREKDEALCRIPDGKGGSMKSATLMLLVLMTSPLGRLAQVDSLDEKGGARKSTLKANPPSLGFGDVELGQRVKKLIALTNAGTSSVTISEEKLTGAGFAVTGLSSPLTLKAGQSFTFTMEFVPHETGTASGDMIFAGPKVSALAIPLRGTGTEPVGHLSDVPAKMDFGNVNVGHSSTREGTLSATDGSVTIRSVTSSSSEFVVSGLRCPVTIAPGHSVPYSVRFTPQQSGTALATLSFASNASDSRVSESLTGNAEPPHVTLSWNASTSPVVGYNVYRSGLSGGPYARINSRVNRITKYTDTFVRAGQTYYYVVVAINSRGKESRYSNQARAVIP